MVDDYISRLSSFFPNKSNTEKNNSTNNTEVTKDTVAPNPKEESTPLNSQDEYTPSNLNHVKATYTLNDLNKKRIANENIAIENNKIDKHEQSGKRNSEISTMIDISQMFSLTSKSESPKSEIEEMIEEMLKLLEKSAVERVITKIIEQRGIELEKDDVLTMSINRDGKFAIDAEKTVINGKTGDDVKILCAAIEGDLNNVTTKDGEIFGEWLIGRIADEMNIDLEKLDESFSFKISFEFKRNLELDLNEILHAHITKDIDDAEESTTTE
ncbi:MAG: hypothetical protein LBK06_07165 [Planctomycetaceae bacterium]|jgi:hypothetical protein|nr:hypothetical protein [Planctomycetaceae bacterium]